MIVPLRRKNAISRPEHNGGQLKMTATESLVAKFGEKTFQVSSFRDNMRVSVDSTRIHEILKYCKETLGFAMLVELTAVDYLEFPDAKDRFGVVYCLLNMTTGERLVVKTFVNDPDPSLASVFDLWGSADWLEREVFDMYGIKFEGHPDLRRLLMPDEFTSFPLRKDYPLRGRGERHNFSVIARAQS